MVGLIGVGLLGGGSAAFAQEAAPTSLVSPESAADKARDLQRAIANRGASPDRVVVVYDSNVGQSEANPNRQRARQVAGGRLLRADTTLGRDIVRVDGADAATVAQRLRGLPGVQDAYPTRSPVSPCRTPIRGLASNGAWRASRRPRCGTRPRAKT